MRTFGKAGHEDPMATLCQMVVETQYEDLPENVVTCAKHSILDTLAVTVGGSAAEGIPESGLPGFEAEQFGEYIKADIAKWAKIIKDSGVTAN